MYLIISQPTSKYEKSRADDDILHVLRLVPCSYTQLQPRWASGVLGRRASVSGRRTPSDAMVTSFVDLKILRTQTAEPTTRTYSYGNERP